MPITAKTNTKISPIISICMKCLNKKKGQPTCFDCPFHHCRMCVNYSRKNHQANFVILVTPFYDTYFLVSELHGESLQKEINGWISYL